MPADLCVRNVMPGPLGLLTGQNVPLEPVEPVLLQSEEGDCAYPAVVTSPRGGVRLAYWHRRRKGNLCSRDAPGYKVDNPIATGPLERYSASISSDGKRIVFNSNGLGILSFTSRTAEAPLQLS